MATDVGEKTYLSHTSQELDDGIDAIPLKALQADLSAEISAREKLQDATVQLIDSGAKNRLTVTSGSGTAYINIQATIPAGEYIVSFGSISSTDTDYTTCQILALSGSSVVSTSPQLQMERGENVSGKITLSSAANKIQIYASRTGTDASGDTVTISDAMLCTESEWNVSQAFADYCPTMAELYQMILDLGGGNRSMSAAPTEEQEEQR